MKAKVVAKEKKLQVPGAPQYKNKPVRLPAQKKPAGEKVRVQVIRPKNIYEALLAFQKERITIPRNGVGRTSSGQPYKYSTLDDTINTIRPVLEKYGMGFTQIVINDQLLTELFHAESETKISSTAPLGKPASMQDYGGRITYLRRYTLTAQLGLSGDEDTDAVPTATVPDKAESFSAPIKPETAEQGQNSEEVAPTAPATPPQMPVAPRSEFFVKARTMIEAAYSGEALEVILRQIGLSKRLSESEKVELVEILHARETEVEGTVR